MKAELLRVGDVVIEEVDLSSLSDADVDALTVFVNARQAESNPEDPPLSAESVGIEARNHPAFVRERGFAGRDASGAIVAWATGYWLLTEENQHLLDVNLAVLAEHRGRGIGTALLRRLVEVAEESGRTLLMGRANDRVPSGSSFARRIGAELGLLQSMNRLVIADLDRELVRTWIDEGPGRAPGYSLVAVDGRYPDDLVEQIVDLHGVMNTAPRDDMATDDEIPTVENTRAMEDLNAKRGMERWFLAARHDASGRLAGWTEVSWMPDYPRTVWQWGTGVRPEHRGHALGKWLKAVMLQKILDERPDIVDIRTTNADSNDAMLGINNALGFTRFHSHEFWQVTVERAKSYLAERAG